MKYFAALLLTVCLTGCGAKGSLTKVPDGYQFQSNCAGEFSVKETNPDGSSVEATWNTKFEPFKDIINIQGLKTDSLSPGTLLSKPLFEYYCKCTCGMLLEVKYTDEKHLAGTISHGLCDKCLIETYVDSGLAINWDLVYKARRRQERGA